MKKIAAIRKELNARFMNRAEIIDGMLTALIAKENLFMIGLPGTGKSALTKALCSSLQGGNFFSYVLTKFTTPEELYGPVSLSGMQNETYRRVTTGRIPEAHVAFLDEVYKGSSAILNTLLPIVNEREFSNDTKTIKLPLQVTFGASNEIEDSADLAAFHDRWVLKYIVPHTLQQAELRNLLTRDEPGVMPTITFQELAEVQKAAKELKPATDVIDALLKISETITQEGMYVSIRKWMQINKVVKAYAYLQGHSEVELEDLDVLEHMLWTTPDSKRAVAKIVAKHNNPIGEKLSKITDAIAEIGTNFDAMTTAQAAEVASKLKKLKGDLAELGNPAKNNKLAAALRDTDKLLRDVLAKKLGLSV